MVIFSVSTALPSTDTYISGQRGIVDTSNLGAHATEHARRSGDLHRSLGKDGTTKGEEEQDPDSPSKSNGASWPTSLEDSAGSPSKRSNSLMQRLSLGGPRHPLDGHGYRHAKRRLRKAVVEHYRYVAEARGRVVFSSAYTRRVFIAASKC